MGYMRTLMLKAGISNRDKLMHPTEYSGMQLFIPAWDTCFWYQRTYISCHVIYFLCFSVTPTDFVNYENDYGVIDENGQWTGSVRGTMEGVWLELLCSTLANYFLKICVVQCAMLNLGVSRTSFVWARQFMWFVRDNSYFMCKKTLS